MELFFLTQWEQQNYYDIENTADVSMNLYFQLWLVN